MKPETQPIVHMQVQPDIQTANAALDIAVLDTLIEQAKLKMSAIREKMNADREDMPEWKEYAEAKKEFDADTKGWRDELSEKHSAYMQAKDDTPLGCDLAKEALALKRLKQLLRRRREESQQLLMPFVATAKLDGE